MTRSGRLHSAWIAAVLAALSPAGTPAQRGADGQFAGPIIEIIAEGDEVAVTPRGEAARRIPQAQDGRRIMITGTTITIRGVVSGLESFRGAVQILARRPGGQWEVLQGLGLLTAETPGSCAWDCVVQIPTGHSPGCEDLEVRAGLISSLCPPGILVDAGSLERFVALSEPTMVTACTIDSSFDRAHLRLTKVGRRGASPGALLPVSSTEGVVVQCAGIPVGVILQLVVQPIGNANRWAMTSYEPQGDGEWWSVAYFGREGWFYDAPSGPIEIDTYARFWVWAVATLRPLPVRGDEGISPEEWVLLKKEVIASSQRVEVVRVVDQDEVRVWISSLGRTTNGVIRLVRPAERIEGGFDAGPAYLSRSPGAEWVVLLRRQAAEAQWIVAGVTNVTKNRGFWVVPAADLGWPGIDYRAIAIVSALPASPGETISSSEISSRAISISDEVPYRVVR